MSEQFQKMAPNFSNVVSDVYDWREVERELIKKEEGFSASPYRDSRGCWTIGYGHCDSTINSETAPWSREYAEQVLSEDFEDAETGARNVCATFDTLNDVRKGVLVQMVFQMGEAGVKKFVSTLRAVNNEDWETAARHMKQSLWAKQTPFRARRMAERMRTGEYNSN